MTSLDFLFSAIRQTKIRRYSVHKCSRWETRKYSYLRSWNLSWILPDLPVFIHSFIQSTHLLFLFTDSHVISELATSCFLVTLFPFAYLNSLKNLSGRYMYFRLHDHLSATTCACMKSHIWACGGKPTVRWVRVISCMFDVRVWPEHLQAEQTTQPTSSKTNVNASHI